MLFSILNYCYLLFLSSNIYTKPTSEMCFSYEIYTLFLFWWFDNNWKCAVDLKTVCFCIFFHFSRYILLKFIILRPSSSYTIMLVISKGDYVVAILSINIFGLWFKFKVCNNFLLYVSNKNTINLFKS